MAHDQTSTFKEIFYGTKNWQEIEQDSIYLPNPIAKALNTTSEGTLSFVSNEGTIVACEFNDGKSQYIIIKDHICIIDENGDLHTLTLQNAQQRAESISITKDPEYGDAKISYSSQGFNSKNINSPNVSFSTSVPCKIVGKFRIRPLTLGNLAAYVRKIADSSKLQEYVKDENNFPFFSANATNSPNCPIRTTIFDGERIFYNNRPMSTDVTTVIEEILKNEDYAFCKQALQVLKAIDPTLFLASKSKKALLGDDLARLMDDKNIQSSLTDTAGDKK